MGKCLNCGTQIDDKYKYCQKCNNQYGKDNALIEIAKTLKQMNWNLGLKNEFTKRTNPKLWKEIEKEWKKKENNNA